MSASASVCTTTQILGKRKAVGSNLLNFCPGEPKIDAPLDANQAHSSGSSSNARGSSLIIVNGRLLPHTKKRYQCIFEGCNKAYSKPSRLAEHERSHTGERPYQCETCKKSYLRETHLHAHARSHLPTSLRPFICDKPGCQKRFWTAQHLRVHIGWHEGAKPFTCTEDGCPESFAKHHQLRSHIAIAHAPPGTKPYRCEHTACTKSFSTNQQLKAHIKIHDEKRYICMHSDCVSATDQAPKYLPTWSALQSHIRTVHPPTCSHASCMGRTFSTQKGLRAHMKLHEQRDMTAAMEGSSDDDADHQPAKRRRGGEWGRDWVCDHEGCTKDFKSKRALSVHINVTHLGQHNFICSHGSCKKSYGYKHLLQRHMAKFHGNTNDTSVESAGGSSPVSDQEDEEMESKPGTPLDIDAITGNNYARAARAKVSAGQALRCPFPDTRPFILETSSSVAPQPPAELQQPAICDYAFRRAYDLRRHLRSSHNIDAQKDCVELWVAQQKLVAWYT